MDWDGLLKSEMDAAVRQRARLKGDDEFVMSVKMVSSRGDIADTCLIWRDGEDKRLVMKLVAQCCQVLGAQAVLVTSDARFLDVDGFCRRFNVPRPEAGFEAFDRERRRVMAGFGDYMGNLPNDCYNDVLIVAVKGPSINRFVSTAYRVTENDIVFSKTEEQQTGFVEINLIPTWWKEAVQ